MKLHCLFSVKCNCPFLYVGVIYYTVVKCNIQYLIGDNSKVLRTPILKQESYTKSHGKIYIGLVAPVAT